MVAATMLPDPPVGANDTVVADPPLIRSVAQRRSPQAYQIVIRYLAGAGAVTPVNRSNPVYFTILPPEAALRVRIRAVPPRSAASASYAAVAGVGGGVVAGVADGVGSRSVGDAPGALAGPPVERGSAAGVGEPVA